MQGLKGRHFLLDERVKHIYANYKKQIRWAVIDIVEDEKRREK